MVSDTRRIRAYRIVGLDGKLSSDQGVEFWQDESGVIRGFGLWIDLIAPLPEDLSVQAAAKKISPLEWLKRKLESVTYLRVEVV